MSGLDKTKIRIIGKYSDFVLKGNQEMVEKQLIDWYMECNGFDETLRMVTDRMNVKIEVLDNDEVF